MRKTLFFKILLFPLFVLSQENTQGITEENKKEVKKRPKVDGWSGATTYSKKEEPKYKGKISGRIKDSKNKEPLEFATVALKKFKSDEIIEGTITDEKGRFLFDEIIIGKYNIMTGFVELIFFMTGLFVVAGLIGRICKEGGWDDEMMD